MSLFDDQLNKPRTGPSMGCSTEKATCSGCDCEHTPEPAIRQPLCDLPDCPDQGKHPVHSAQDLMWDGPDLKAGDTLFKGVEFISSSFVSAPPCKRCGLPMKYLSATNWACQDKGCPALGTPVVTGVGGIVQVGD